MSTLRPPYLIESHRRFLLASFVVAVFFIYSFAGVLFSLLKSWYGNASYSHGILVLIISGYLIWDRRHRLARIQTSPNLCAGAPLLLFSLLLYLAGNLGGLLALQELSLIVALNGTLLLLLGTEFLLTLLFPVLYMLFMLTSWDLLTQRLHEPFQYISAYIGTELMQFIGIAAYREAIYIELPNITLEVAKVCSGVNYLIAVAAIGIPLAYIALNSWKRRILLIVYGLIMAVIANGVRVALIGTLAYYDLSGDLHGPLHTLHAMFVAVAGYIFLFIGVWVLSDKRKSREAETVEPTDSTNRQSTGKPYPRLPYIVALAGLFILGTIVNFHTPLPVPPATPLATAYSNLPGWLEIPTGDKSMPVRLSGVDEELLRTFRNYRNRVVRLYVAYYSYQVQGKEIVSYNLDHLHEGATKIKLFTETSSAHEPIEVNRVVTETSTGKSLTYFWYEMNGKTVADRFLSKLYLSWHSLIDRQTNGALIMVTIDIEENKDPMSKQGEVETFIKEVLNRL